MKALSDDEKKILKEYFNEWLDTKDSIKELNENAREFVASAADVVEAKKPVITKLFGFLKKKVEDGDAELDDISELAEMLGM